MGAILTSVLQPAVLLCTLAGVVMGISFGAMPGLTSTMGVCLLMPLTFSMGPAEGMLMLIGIFCGALYGGSITAILINTPGTPSAAATVLDGYPFTLRGEAGRALGISTLASFGGGIISGTVMILIAQKIAMVSLSFNAPESFALAFFGLSIIAGISGKNLVKGLMAGCMGIMLSLIGIDNITAFTRYSFGSIYLMNGLSFIPVLVGLFALSQCFITCEDLFTERPPAKATKNPLPSKADLKIIIPTIIRGGLTGTFIGIIPGAGGDISAFISYDMERRFSKHPEKFGTGVPEGIAAPESSNNGTTGGALIPLLALGIPGDANTAVMLGALQMHNLTPGPQLFMLHVDTVRTVFAGFIVANIFVLILGLAAQPLFVKIVSIPKRVLIPVILVLCSIGSFAINNNYYDVLLMFISGIIGYLLTKGGYPLSPIVLALILGQMCEGNLRRSLVLSQGSYSILFTRPISCAFIVIALCSLAWPIVKGIRRYTKKTE
ncbi:MAG: tripartite tricarboxylate transporter permease [Clostridiales bacterium]|nr:tripartite tricarboxylate transporter permease [Clostridiales bacterium]